MRKTFIGLMAAGALFMAAPAQSHSVPNNGESYVFVGAVPCAVACSYWVDNGYTPCEFPFPPGAYLDRTTKAAPTPPTGKVMICDNHFESTLDWDSFACASAAGAELAQGANTLGDLCDNLIGPGNAVPVGCDEDMSVPMKVGQKLVIRAYNWSDVADANGEYGFLFV